MFSDAYFPRVNGVGVSVKCFGEALAKMGHKVYVVCPSYDDSKKAVSKKSRSKKSSSKKNKKEIVIEKTEIKGFSIMRVPSVTTIFSSEDRYVRLTKWKLIKKEMDKFKPDIIHINAEFALGILGMIYARRNKVALVYTSHTMWESYIENYVHCIPSSWSRKIGKELVCFFAKRAQVVISPTERMFKLLSSYGIDRPIEVLPTGIDDSISKIDEKELASFKKDIYKEFPILENKKVLLYVGRVVKEKNLDMLFDVFSKVKEKIKDSVLFFVGGGPELDNLKEKAKAHPLSSSICFAGYRDRNILSYFYHLADVFVFPSCTETQGLVTIEAMRTSLPVVAIGEMGTLDVMQGDHGGFMVKNDVNEFADRVVDLLSDKKLHSQKSQEAKDWSAKWSMDYLTPKLESYYKKAIEAVKKAKTKKRS